MSVCKQYTAEFITLRVVEMDNYIQDTVCDILGK